MNNQDSTIQTLLKDQIFATTYTKPVLLRKLRILKELINYKVFKAPQADGHLLLEHFRQQSSLYQEQSWLEKFLPLIEQITASNIDPIIQTLENLSQSVQMIILYTPFSMPEDYQEKVGSWIKQNLGSNFFIDLSVDPELIGGCAISYKGIYRDESLSALIKRQETDIIASLKEFK